MEDTFKGIIDLIDMQADIYYDDMGNDVRVEPIPEDMQEKAQEYQTTGTISLEMVALRRAALMAPA